MAIRVSKKYGLNPSLLQCPICAQDSGIALLGSGYNHGEEAPMQMCDSTPCDNCMKMMKAGILLVECEDNSDKDNPVRTGRTCAIKEEAAKKLFGEIPEKRVAFIEATVFHRMIPDERFNEVEKI